MHPLISPTGKIWHLIFASNNQFLDELLAGESLVNWRLCIFFSIIGEIMFIFVSQFSQLLSCVRLFTTPWTAARQVSLSITNSWSLLKVISIELGMPSNHLIFPSIRVFSNGSALRIRWPKYWSFSFSISPSINIQDWFPLGWTGWTSLLSKGCSCICLKIFWGTVMPCV